jgi:hypothetical protein
MPRQGQFFPPHKLCLKSLEEWDNRESRKAGTVNSVVAKGHVSHLVNSGGGIVSTGKMLSGSVGEEFSQNALNHMNRRNSCWMNGLSKCSQRYADTHTVLSELSE